MPRSMDTSLTDTIRPLLATDMAPVSSEMITEMASVLSVMPNPALCLAPWPEAVVLFSDNGSIHPAATTLPS
jgi:hypothetical protein